MLKIEQKFQDLRALLPEDTRSRIRLNANGGNAILLLYESTCENQYIERVYKEFQPSQIINLAQLFVEYIDSRGYDNILEEFDMYENELEFLFNNIGSDNNYFNLIIGRIKAVFDNGQIPVLIRSGILFGTGIENNMIIESDIIHHNIPMIIFYPGSYENNVLKYLGIKNSSDYRTLVI